MISPRDRGVLILVVGPSGAGKDSLLRAARTRFAADDRFDFVRRVVTRPGGDPAVTGEEGVSDREFAAREVEGAFAFSWRAHGLGYGLPRAAVERGLRRGSCVVANVSRSVVDEARARYPRVAVVLVTASAANLAARLAARRRETLADIERRLARADAVTNGTVDVTISNDGAVADAIAGFQAALAAFADARPRPALGRAPRRVSG